MGIVFMFLVLLYAALVVMSRVLAAATRSELAALATPARRAAIPQPQVSQHDDTVLTAVITAAVVAHRNRR